MKVANGLTLTVILAALTVISTVFAQAGTVYYISPTGSDSNSGTSITNPWKTFAHAETFLVPGTTLDLLDGTYNGSNSGYPAIDCTAGWSNGTASGPITIQSLNERKGHIVSDGTPYRGPFSIRGCSYWNVYGLWVTDADSTSESGESATMSIGGQGLTNDHLTIRHNIVDHTNRCENEHGLGLVYDVSNSLVEENEVYYFHRHAFIDYDNGNTSANHNTFRRNYSNRRAYPGLSCYAGATGAGFQNYGAQYTEWDNNISENNSGGSGAGVEPVTGSTRGVGNALELGNISLNDAQGSVPQPHENNSARCPHDLTYKNIVIVNPTSTGLYVRSSQNVSVGNMSMFGPTAPSGNYVQDDPFSACVASSFPSFSEIVTNATTGPGFYIAAGAATIDHSGVHGASSYNSGGTVTNSLGTGDPGYGSCYLWAPVGSAASVAGAGATVLYAYEDGALTTKPLWNAVGQFAFQAASVSGLNDVAGTSLFDVGSRLHVNSGGCTFPTGYPPASGLNGPPAKPQGLNFR